VLRGFDQSLGVMEVQFPQEPVPDSERSQRTFELVGRLSRALECIRTSQMDQAMANTVSGVAEAESLAELQSVLLKGAFDITDCKTGAVLQLDNKSGGLRVAKCEPEG